MNILLFAPALFLTYLATQGLLGTLIQLAICASTQILLAVPFLLENPYNYLKGAFDLGRVFLHKWTVNYRFLPQDIFVSQSFHLGLLVAHVLLLTFAAWPFWQLLKGYAKLNQEPEQKPKWAIQLLLLPMFMSNFIGIAAARSLHYQFYIWYYHQLSYLLWCTSLPTQVKLLLLGLIELCWNTYPSTEWSSALLHCCHVVLLISLFLYMKRMLNMSSHIKKSN